MVYFTLLIVGNILVLTSGFSLNCTNDFETHMSCYIDAHNCTRLSLRMDSLDTEDTRTGTCEFKPCVTGCCCSAKLKFLVFGDDFSANIFQDTQRVHTQRINVDDTIKPPAPSINSIQPLNGIYRIQWSSNAKEPIRGLLKAVVTYQKKGHYKKTSEHVDVSTMVDRNYFEIRGHSLEPNETYVVNVKTYTNVGVFSDSSNETEFTTASATNGGPIALILCLSVAAIIFTGAAFVLSVRLKAKLWDKAATDERPKFLDIKPNKKVILTPESLSVYSLSVEPLVPQDSLTSSKESLSDSRSGQTSGISTASSSFDYAATQPVDIEASILKALKTDFPIFTPAENTFSSEEPIQGSTRPPLTTFSPPVFYDNKSYISTNQTNQTEGMDLQMTCDTGYSSSEGPTLHDFITPPHVSVTIETDMSYQPCTLSGETSGDS